jgi:hypothetical protein
MMWLLVVVSLVFTQDEGSPKVQLLLASSYEECNTWSNIGNAGAFDNSPGGRRAFFCYRLMQ